MKTRWKIFRKKLVFVQLIVVVVVLTGCGSKSNAGNSSTGDIQVKMAVWGSGAASIFSQAAEVFSKRPGNPEFVVEMQPGDYNQYLGAKTAANDLPDLFFVVPYTQVAQFAQNDRIIGLDDQPFVKRIYASTKPAITYNGRIYAYPMVQQAIGILYNQNIFKELGIDKPPETFGELETLCNKLVNAGYVPFASMYKENWSLNHSFNAVQAAVLKDIPGWIKDMNAGETSFKVEKSDEVFRFFDLMKKYSGNNYMDSDGTTAYNALASGVNPMLFTGEWALRTVANVNPDLPIGFFAAPVTDNPADSKLAVDVAICVVVNKNGKHIPEALKALDYISDPNDSDGWMSLANDSMGSGPPGVPFTGKNTFLYMTDIHRYLAGGMVNPWLFQQLVPGSQTIIGDTIQGYFANIMDMDATLRELDEQYKDLLESTASP
jgi:raffinose/stachyose/melibiose transport system substrate-binding protein